MLADRDYKGARKMNTFENIDNAALLAEISRRGLLSELHGAVGALYDNLDTNGVLDSDSNTTSYLAYRLRPEDAKLASNSEEPSTPNFWQQKIDAMDADGPKSRRPRP